jgi:hypothetical protein
MQLIYTKTRQPVLVGDSVELDPGDVWVINSIMMPTSPASTGRVYLKHGPTLQGFYPSVIGAEWDERPDREEGQP